MWALCICLSARSQGESESSIAQNRRDGLAESDPWHLVTGNRIRQRDDGEFAGTAYEYSFHCL